MKFSDLPIPRRFKRYPLLSGFAIILMILLLGYGLRDIFGLEWIQDTVGGHVTADKRLE